MRTADLLVGNCRDVSRIVSAPGIGISKATSVAHQDFAATSCVASAGACAVPPAIFLKRQIRLTQHTDMPGGHLIPTACLHVCLKSATTTCSTSPRASDLATSTPTRIAPQGRRARKATLSFLHGCVVKSDTNVQCMTTPEPRHVLMDLVRPASRLSGPSPINVTPCRARSLDKIGLARPLSARICPEAWSHCRAAIVLGLQAGEAARDLPLETLLQRAQGEKEGARGDGLAGDASSEARHVRVLATPNGGGAACTAGSGSSRSTSSAARAFARCGRSGAAGTGRSRRRAAPQLRKH